jgi:uncharacterized protein (TIGR02246 family)
MTTSDEAAIEMVMNEFGDSWNRHDMPAFAALFAADADFVDVFGNWPRGRAEIEKALTARHATVFKEARFTRKKVSICFPRPDIAVVHRVWELSRAVDRQGQPLPPGLGIMSYLMSRAHGVWRISAFQNTTVGPPPAARGEPGSRSSESGHL